MPVRKGFRKFDSAEVQGEDSWVRIRAATMAEIIAQENRRDVSRGVRYWLGRLIGMIARLFVRTKVGDVLDQGVNRLGSFVHSWNWVDDKGEDLPVPSEAPTVMQSLTMDEVNFIQSCVGGQRQSDEEKN